ncbi:MAG: roadblock/LC7 domain-containing protein [Candidatus Thorarchaeota archaeon]
MPIGTGKKLDNILSDLMQRSGGRFRSCIITNERGLIVAWKGDSGISRDTLAAMMSLFSETSQRIISNLGIGKPQAASIKTIEATLSLHEFYVAGKLFRIAAILDESKHRFSFFRRGMSLARMQENIDKAASEIKTVLEK